MKVGPFGPPFSSRISIRSSDVQLIMLKFVNTIWSQDYNNHRKISSLSQAMSVSFVFIRPVLSLLQILITAVGLHGRALGNRGGLLTRLAFQPENRKIMFLSVRSKIITNIKSKNIKPVKTTKTSATFNKTALLILH